MIDETLFDAEEKMEKAVTVAKEDLATLRTGRANPAMFARLHVDYYGAPTPIPQIIAESAAHLAHFHANDPNLLGPGMGEVKFEPIIKALKDAGYDGYLSVEVFDFKLGAEKIASESIRYLKKVCHDRS